MEVISLSLIFWYGVLHAFGPDHLTAIADFSIGKNKKKTITITALFAVGHGVSLLIFAKILESFNINKELLSYGDTVSALVILSIGIYLLFMVLSNKIHLNRHIHNNEEHIHIYFGAQHNHNSKKDVTSAFAIGTLMGIGGVRGMLVTLGFVEASAVDFSLVLAFASGVMIIFVGFGLCILYINKNLLTSKTNIRRAFFSAGLVSVVVGTNMLIT